MESKLELRAFPLEVRGQGTGLRLAGHAAVFGAMSEDLGGFREIIAPGAFRESLAISDQDIVMAWSHDLSKPMASRDAGSLVLTEDSIGLAFDAALNDTSWSRDAHAAVTSKTVRRMSFMFRVREGGESWRREGKTDIRTVTAARLFEVSPVVFPAYTQTSVAVRSAADILAGRPALAALERMALEVKRRGIGC